MNSFYILFQNKTLVLYSQTPKKLLPATLLQKKRVSAIQKFTSNSISDLAPIITNTPEYINQTQKTILDPTPKSDCTPQRTPISFLKLIIDENSNDDKPPQEDFFDNIELEPIVLETQKT